jgi:hypothetical protein
VIVAITVTVTVVVDTVNVAVVAPVGTVTFAGTVAAALSLVSPTTAPPVGAGPVKVTVPVDVNVPPTTLGGFKDRETSDGGFTVRVAVCVTSAVAEITTGVEEPTPWVVTVKVAVVEPEAMVTLGGTVAAAALPLDNVTATPSTDAGLSSVTVPVEGAPPGTLVGFTDTAVRDGGSAVMFAVWIPLPVAVIVTPTGEGTGTIVIGNVVDVAPSGTVTVAGTVTNGE